MKSSWLPMASLALAGCLWGTGFLFGKIALRETTVSDNVAFRFLCGSIVLWPCLLRKGIRFSAICGTPVDHRFSCLADCRHLAHVARPQFSPVFARAAQGCGIRGSAGVRTWRASHCFVKDKCHHRSTANIKRRPVGLYLNVGGGSVDPDHETADGEI